MGDIDEQVFIDAAEAYQASIAANDGDRWEGDTADDWAFRAAAASADRGGELLRRRVIRSAWEPADATPAADGQDGRDG
jgi:hypothetical protein